MPRDVPAVARVDVLVIGAGPSGLFAAYYAGFRGLSVALIDTLAEPGGQVATMYPEKFIHDVAGLSAIRGRDLVTALVAQAGQYHPTYLLGRRATQLASVGDELEVGMADETAIRAGALLITAGIGGFTPRALTAGKGWEGRGLVFFVPDPDEHAGKDVVVVGGGDSALDWAIALSPIARSVRLVHRRHTFRAHAATVQKARELGVEIITDAEVTALRGDVQVRECEITVDGCSRVLPAQLIVAALGFIAELGPIENWGVKTYRRTIVVDSTMKTTRERVFAAGDVAHYPGKVRLIATGFGEAATAVNNIAVLLRPDEHLFPGHSSG